MRKVLVPILAMVAVAASSLMLASPTPSVADQGGCANPRASKGAEKANPHSAHGPDKQGDRDCGSEVPPAQTPTPASTPTPTPTPSPSPTPTPASTPTPTPALTPSPTPTGPQADVKAVGVTVGVPSTAASGLAFQISVAVGTHNNGPTATAMVDVTFVLALPADCTATSNTTVTVLNRSLPMSSPVVVSRVWNVTCSQPGSHQFTVTGSLAPSAGQTFTDPNPTNNGGSGTAITLVN